MANQSIKSKNKYLLKNTLLFSIGSIGSKVLFFLLVPLYTNFLSTTDYGYADTVTTFVGLIVFFLTLNVADAVLRFVIERKGDENGILSFAIRVWAIGSLLLAASTIVFSFFDLIRWPIYCYYFLIIYFALYSLNDILNNFLKGIDKVKDVVIAGLITTLVTILLNIIFIVFLKKGLIGYFVSLCGGLLTSCFYCSFRIGKPLFLFWREKVCKEKIKLMLIYCLPLIFNGIGWWANNSIDKYFVIAICGQSENGIYSISYKIPTILTVFASIFAQAWNLSAIKNYDKEDKDGFFSKIYAYYGAFLVIVCSLLILFNKYIALFLFAKDFYIAWKCSSILLISIIFSSLSGFLGSVFAAAKQSRIFALSTIVSAIINCALNFALIPIIGIIGAAIATSISFTAIWIIRLICVKKYIKLKIDLTRDIVAYLLIVVQCFLEHLDGFVAFVQLMIVFLLCLIYLKEIKELSKKSMVLVKGIFVKKRDC